MRFRIDRGERAFAPWIEQSFRKNLHYFDKYHRRSVAVCLAYLFVGYGICLSGQGNWKWLAGPPRFQRGWAAHPAGGWRNTSLRSERAGVSGPRPEAPDMPQTTHGRMAGLTFARIRWSPSPKGAFNDQ